MSQVPNPAMFQFPEVIHSFKSIESAGVRGKTQKPYREKGKTRTSIGICFNREIVVSLLGCELACEPPDARHRGQTGLQTEPVTRAVD